MNSIYINKKQLLTLSLSLMSLTRDNEVYNYAINKGIFKEDEIGSYIDTIKRFLEVINDEDGALLVTEINMDDVQDCVDLWGNSIGGLDL